MRRYRVTFKFDAGKKDYALDVKTPSMAQALDEAEKIARQLRKIRLDKQPRSATILRERRPARKTTTG